MQSRAPVRASIRPAAKRREAGGRAASLISCIRSTNTCPNTSDSKMPLVIRLPAEIEAGLRRLSDEENRSQADIVRALIAERLGKRKARARAYAVAQRLGVIGCDDDSRTDVAERHSGYVRAALLAKTGSSRRPVRRRTRRG
jgi:predicted DNA-binding protein